MQIKIAQFTFGRRRYFVIYPDPTPGLPPHWVVLDARGRLLGDQMSPEIDNELWKAADYAALWAPAAPLEEYWDRLKPSAFERVEELGWGVRYGAGREDVLLPTTAVWVYRGRPSDFRTRGDIHRAMRLLADCVREKRAEIVPPETAPSSGVVVTAAGLAVFGPY